MPISEISNALLLTYLATEYLVASNRLDVRQSADWAAQLLKPRNVLAGLVVAALNLVERFSGAFDRIDVFFHAFFHAPKIIFAGSLYMVALYIDCSKVNHKSYLPVRLYLGKVGVAFCYVLPVYPFLAVLISFGFLCIITIFDLLRINPEFLQWPIYYGTLYGPFSFVYWKVKRSVVDDQSSLPSSSAGRRLGNS
mmetsp:Transcript_4218/g.5551  ORF Transcript_4218/g.5551 Transcript_4218/m.5551 type:complete len:195 (-) Transcript_4218:191-775(-)